jgi:hypothetical protein
MTGQMRNEKLPALAEALSGMRFGPQHAHAAASLLRATGLLDAGLPELQERVTAHLAAIPASRGADCDGATGPGAGWAGGPAAERLNEIPGPGREAAAALIAETGLDTSRFPAAEALASRAGLTRPQISPAPARAAGRRATATPAPSGSRSPPPTRRRTRTRSRASASAVRPPVPAGTGGRRPAAPWAVPSWSSCGTCSTTPPPATATSDPTGTPGTATAAATPATPAASSRPSATTSSSPSGRTPPDSAASDNRTTLTQAPGSACRGTISPCPELWSREWG